MVSDLLALPPISLCHHHDDVVVGWDNVQEGEWRNYEWIVRGGEKDFSVEKDHVRIFHLLQLLSFPHHSFFLFLVIGKCTLHWNT